MAIPINVLQTHMLPPLPQVSTPDTPPSVEPPPLSFDEWWDTFGRFQPPSQQVYPTPGSAPIAPVSVPPVSVPPATPQANARPKRNTKKSPAALEADENAVVKANAKALPKARARQKAATQADRNAINNMHSLLYSQA